MVDYTQNKPHIIHYRVTSNGLNFANQFANLGVMCPRSIEMYQSQLGYGAQF